MALKQETIAMHRTDANGNKVLQMPITQAENVEGIEFLPVGTIIPFGGNTVPTGYLTCNGAAVSRTTYADLFAVIGTTYGKGNGSTTFNLPNLGSNLVSDVASGDIPVAGNGVTVGLVGKNTSGQDVYAGLARENSTYPLTAYKQHYGKSYGLTNSEAAAEFVTSLGITTDETKSGIVAKMSATKTTVKYIIKAFAGVSNGGSVDARNIMDAVEANQANISDINNRIAGISDYIVESYRNGTEWYEVYKSGKVRQGGEVPAISGIYYRTVNLHLPMQGKYSCVCNTNDVNHRHAISSNLQSTNFNLGTYLINGGESYTGAIWVVEGMGA